MTENDSNEILLNALKKIKFNFAKLFVSEDSGSGTYFEFEITPYDFLKFAKKDILNNDKRARINAITNAKRAIDCQTDTILSILNLEFSKPLPAAATSFIELVNHKENANEKSTFKLIAALGLAPINLISKVRKLRHKLEHYYESPSQDEAREAIELAEFYLNATDNKIKMIWSIAFTNEEIDNYKDPYPSKTIYIDFRDRDALINVRVDKEEIVFANTEVLFYLFLKLLLHYKDEEDIESCMKKILEQIKHPQAHLDIQAFIANS